MSRKAWGNAMQVDLSGQVAVVTGAAQGIGRAVAGAFAQSGARVVFTDLDERHTAQAAASVPRLGEPHLSYVMDVANGGEVDAVIARIAEEAGRIDILVNNAGIGVKAADRKPIDEFPVETWEEMLRIDLTGVFRVSRATVPHMKARKSGRIINIASVLGLVPMRLQSSYVAAKAGVVNLTRSMALELAPFGILVNGVAPGSTATDGWKRWINDAKSEELDLHAKLMSHIPLGRPASTEEIAQGVLFLAAPASSYITGHVLPVDGGWTAGFARDF
jgi:3-oxoacyl-[acyl-carrier protein] reductase